MSGVYVRVIEFKNDKKRQIVFGKETREEVLKSFDEPAKIIASKRVSVISEEGYLRDQVYNFVIFGRLEEVSLALHDIFQEIYDAIHNRHRSPDIEELLGQIKSIRMRDMFWDLYHRRGQQAALLAIVRAAKEAVTIAEMGSTVH